VSGESKGEEPVMRCVRSSDVKKSLFDEKRSMCECDKGGAKQGRARHEEAAACLVLALNLELGRPVTRVTEQDDAVVRTSGEVLGQCDRLAATVEVKAFRERRVAVELVRLAEVDGRAIRHELGRVRGVPHDSVGLARVPNSVRVGVEDLRVPDVAGLELDRGGERRGGEREEGRDGSREAHGKLVGVGKRREESRG
jgi:hypothetical protein